MTYCSEKASKALKEGIVEKVLKRRAWYKQKLDTTMINVWDVWPHHCMLPTMFVYTQQHISIYSLVLVSL